jgi:hypothetical protein
VSKEYEEKCAIRKERRAKFNTLADLENDELLDLFREESDEYFAEFPKRYEDIRTELLRRMTAAQESHCRMGVACPLHEGQVHGQEASELRSKLEKYIEYLNSMKWNIMEVGIDVPSELQEILDSTDARDALAYEEETSVLLEKEEGTRDDAHEKLKRGLFFLDLACHGALGTGHKRVYLAVCGGFDNGTGTQIAVLPDVQEFFDDIAKALGYPNVKALYAKEADEEEAAVEFICHSKLGEPKESPLEGLDLLRALRVLTDENHPVTKGLKVKLLIDMNPDGVQLSHIGQEMLEKLDKEDADAQRTWITHTDPAAVELELRWLTMNSSLTYASDAFQKSADLVAEKLVSKDAASVWTQEDEPEISMGNHHFYLQWAINFQGQYVFRVYNPKTDKTSEVCKNREDAKELAQAIAFDIVEAEANRSRE